MSSAHYTTWAQGLLSAARSVSGSISQLVKAAQSYAQHKHEVGSQNREQGESEIIGASKGVLAATAQLIAAVKARSAIGEQTNTPLVNAAVEAKLSEAAKAIQLATGGLMMAAKAARKDLK